MTEGIDNRQPNILSVEGSNGAILQVDANRLGLEGLSDDEKMARLMPLSRFMLGNATQDDFAGLEAAGATIGVKNEDGSVYQGTLIGSGLAVEEHIPPQH